MFDYWSIKKQARERTFLACPAHNKRLHKKFTPASDMNKTDWHNYYTPYQQKYQEV